MNIKRKFILLVVLVVVLTVVNYYLPQSNHLIYQYDRFIFNPFQSFRIITFGLLPVSVGDVMYLIGGIALLVTLARWVKYVARFRGFKLHLAVSVLNLTNIVLFVYLFFIFGWGANYYKPTLRESWQMGKKDTGYSMQDTAARRRVFNEIVAFDQFLVEKLNTYAPHYHNLSFPEVNDRSVQYYRTYTDSKVRLHGLGLKRTLFGYFIERLAVEGYYNPFTGEGQVNTDLPGFTLPFLACHEMAHQAGIAAEDDANLMAYALGTLVNDSSFNYSSYLNLWIYTNNRLFRRDSALAHKFEAQLNKLTTAHIDTLEQISRKYRNKMAHFSSDLYDSYLKMQDQKEGIRSYGNVTTSAWLLELSRKNKKPGIINIP